MMFSGESRKGSVPASRSEVRHGAATAALAVIGGLVGGFATSALVSQAGSTAVVAGCLAALLYGAFPSRSGALAGVATALCVSSAVRYAPSPELRLVGVVAALAPIAPSNLLSRREASCLAIAGGLCGAPLALVSLAIVVQVLRIGVIVFRAGTVLETVRDSFACKLAVPTLAALCIGPPGSLRVAFLVLALSVSALRLPTALRLGFGISGMLVAAHIGYALFAPISEHVPPPVILISADTLRDDFVGPVSTPTLHSLGRESWLFANAQAPSSWTTPSMAAVMTGQHPAALGVTGQVALPRTSSLLSERLRGAGYYTLGANTNWTCGESLGFAKGFDVYRQFSFHEGDAALDLVLARIPWLRQRPFFLWLHLSTPHSVYRPSQGLPAFLPKRLQGLEPEKKAVIERYSSEVWRLDQEVSRLLTALRELALYDRSLVIFLSDHGEEFWERGGQGHAITLEPEVLQVPLFIKPPSGLPRRVSERVTLEDVSPTILDILGLEPAESRDGLSLARGVPELRALYAETRYDQLVQSVVVGDWRLVRDSKGSRLYDLRSDPYHERPVQSARRDVGSVLESQLDVWARKVGDAALALSAERAPLSASEWERLEQLGYVAGEPPGVAESDQVP